MPVMRNVRPLWPSALLASCTIEPTCSPSASASCRDMRSGAGAAGVGDGVDDDAPWADASPAQRAEVARARKIASAERAGWEKIHGAMARIIAAALPPLR